MSGGSFNYLCFTETTDLFHKIDDMEDMEQYLIKREYTDIAKDVRRLIEYCKSAEVRMSVLFEQLEKVFHDIEWHTSGDISYDDLIKTLENYRNGG